jgi:hypothetical protein
MSGAMSAFGPKRTSASAPHTSAFGGKADIEVKEFTAAFERKADLAQGLSKCYACYSCPLRPRGRS